MSYAERTTTVTYCTNGREVHNYDKYGPYSDGATHKCRLCGRLAKFEGEVWYYWYDDKPQVPAVQSINSQEEKVFQVTNYNHATGALDNNAYKTQEEAQNALEVKAANLRSNLQTKQFFTLSLLDTKTGKFLGSVSDLPPAVTLTGASS